MVKEMIALLTAGVMSTSLLTTFDTASQSDLAHELGISQSVLDCANKVLANSDEESLTALIKNTQAVGTPDQTPEQAALVQCVLDDPFGIKNGTPDEKIAYLISKGLY